MASKFNLIDTKLEPIYEYAGSVRPMSSCNGSKKSHLFFKAKSVTSRAPSKQSGSVRSNIADYKRKKMIEIISKMDDNDIEKLAS